MFWQLWDRGCLTGQFSGQAITSFRTHHVLRDKQVKIQAVFADSGRRGRSGAWLPAAGPGDTDCMTSR